MRISDWSSDVCSSDLADRLRLEEIELHEAFDRRFARPIGIIHPPRDLALHVEGQSILRPLRDRMEMAAHRPQEILGAVELAIFGTGQEPRLDQDRKSTRLNSSH